MKAFRAGLMSFGLAILLCASFIGGARYGKLVFQRLGVPVQEQTAVVVQPSTEPADVAPTFSLFWEAWNVVTHNYVDKQSIDVKALTYGAIRGMVAALGDTGHSRFLTPADLQQEEGSLRGNFVGIGAEIGARNGQIMVLNPLDGSPAQQAGLQAGDVILAVNGEDVGRGSLPDVMTKLRGANGTSVTLRVQHPGGSAPVDVTVTRGRVTIQPVSSFTLPAANVEDIRLSSFDSKAAASLKFALQAAEAQHVSGVVLDLRDNPGGILDQAVDVASQFMAKGTVAVVKDAGGSQRRIEARPGGAALNLPVTVVVNSGTASAAEVVASALQANHRATIVGQPTFGTGTVLSTFRLKDGSAILLGTSEWLTPDGQLLKGKGVQPDVAIRLTGQSQVLTPARAKQLSPAQIESSGDAQLLAAAKYLDDHLVVRTGQPSA